MNEKTAAAAQRAAIAGWYAKRIRTIIEHRPGGALAAALETLETIYTEVRVCEKPIQEAILPVGPPIVLEVLREAIEGRTGVAQAVEELELEAVWVEGKVAELLAEASRLYAWEECATCQYRREQHVGYLGSTTESCGSFREA